MSENMNDSGEGLFFEREEDTEKVEYEIENEPIHQHEKERPIHISRRKRGREWGDEEALQLGEVMRQAREQAGLELIDVIEDTRIHKQHLEALEFGNREEMPPIVYVMAMIRKLGVLYNMPQEDIESLIIPLRQTNFEEVPKDLEKSAAFEPSEENRRLLRLITIVIIAVGFLIITASLAALLTWWLRRDKSQVQYPPFAIEQLSELQPKPKLNIPPAP